MIKPIVLVEDDASDLELTLVALTKARLVNEVVILRDGEEALEFFSRRGRHELRAKGNPALILLDIKLPKVDGLEVLSFLKADPELKSIPVVMLTNSREEPDLAKSYTLGVNAFVTKPVRFIEFVEAIQELGAFWAVFNEPPPDSVRIAKNGV